MAFKDIQVIVDLTPGSVARVALAGALAVAHEAHLSALHVAPRYAIPAFADAQIPAAVREAQARAIREETDRVANSVRESAAKAGLPIEMRSRVGAVAEITTAHARNADLTIVGQDMETDDPGADQLAETLLFGSGRPVLIVPRYGTHATPGTRVLIAWNGTREAARAVNDALPLLVRARQVRVLSVNPPDRSGENVPGADIAVHLARHGVKVETAITAADDTGVGDLLLSRAADDGADLIVMGAYGHARWREVVLGGATRHLLAHMTVPVLMAH